MNLIAKNNFIETKNYLLFVEGKTGVIWIRIIVMVDNGYDG